MACLSVELPAAGPLCPEFSTVERSCWSRCLRADGGCSLLVLADLHVNLHAVNRLGDWLVKNKRSVDAVIVCGGMADLAGEEAHLSPEKKAIAEGDMSAVLSGLESVVCRVLYVPGDGDVAILAGGKLKRLSTHSLSLQSRSFRLFDDLVLCGHCYPACSTATGSKAVGASEKTAPSDEDANGGDGSGGRCAAQVAKTAHEGVASGAARGIGGSESTVAAGAWILDFGHGLNN